MALLMVDGRNGLAKPTSISLWKSKQGTERWEIEDSFVELQMQTKEGTLSVSRVVTLTSESLGGEYLLELRMKKAHKLLTKTSVSIK